MNQRIKKVEYLNWFNENTFERGAKCGPVCIHLYPLDTLDVFV